MNRASMYLVVVIADLVILHASLGSVCAEIRARAEQGVIRTVQAAVQHSADTSDGGYFAWGWPVRQERTIRKTFPGNAAHRITAIEVDGINGSIKVLGGDSDEVEMVANETIQAESQEDADRGVREVTLDVTHPGDSLRLYVDGPFRRDHRGFFYEYEGYAVQIDFVLTVPRHMNLKLRTVNAPDISVKDVSGHYRIRDVNGSIEMLNVGGSGEVHTVNGDVTVVFRENPTDDSEVGDVNGRIELTFAPNLSADLRLASFSGGIYGDFPLTQSSAAPGGDAMRKFTTGPWFQDVSTRLGSGGPEISAETISGDIRVH